MNLQAYLSVIGTHRIPWYEQHLLHLLYKQCSEHYPEYSYFDWNFEVVGHWLQQLLGFNWSSQPPLSPRWLPALRSPENASTVKIKKSTVVPIFLFPISRSLPGLLQWTTWSPYKGTKGWSSTGSSWESREEPRCLPQWTESTSLCSPPETVGEIFGVEERDFCLKNAWAESARKQYVIQSYFQLLTQEKPERKKEIMRKIR